MALVCVQPLAFNAAMVAAFADSGNQPLWKRVFRWG
jgi:hypothetical protein